MTDEIQYIISGKSKIMHGATLKTIARYLERGNKASKLVKGDKHFRSEEEKRLNQFIDKNKLWVEYVDLNNYVSKGAEQKVYLKDQKHVLKLSDAIYYESWVDYLHNLILNNFFFADTAYKLIGFHKIETILFALVEQPYVRANEKTDLSKVKEFMNVNGFNNVKNNDYYNPTLKIILEDLHDENVLTQNGLLFFIDTVFYIR